MVVQRTLRITKARPGPPYTPNQASEGPPLHVASAGRGLRPPDGRPADGRRAAGGRGLSVGGLGADAGRNFRGLPRTADGGGRGFADGPRTGPRTPPDGGLFLPDGRRTRRTAEFLFSQFIENGGREADGPPKSTRGRPADAHGRRTRPRTRRTLRGRHPRTGRRTRGGPRRISADAGGLGGRQADLGGGRRGGRRRTAAGPAADGSAEWRTRREAGAPLWPVPTSCSFSLGSELSALPDPTIPRPGTPLPLLALLKNKAPPTPRIAVRYARTKFRTP